MGEALGTVLRRRRVALGLTQQGLAERAGVSLGMVRDLEQCRTRRPRRPYGCAVLAALGLPPEPALQAPVPDAHGESASADPAAMGDSSADLAVGVLGPVVVRRGGREVAVGSRLRRALLARLALAVNTTVAVGDLIELLWAGAGPRRPAEAVHTHVWRLRSVLEPGRPERCRGGIVQRCADGYRLELDESRVDLTAFQHGLRAVDQHEGDVLGGYEAALARWRGYPAADVPALAYHPAVTALLDEHAGAVIRYADLARDAGQPARAMPLLRRAAAEYPLHEPLQAALMATLAAAGRQADALDVYRGVRRHLAEELGIAPGRELTDAHRMVLRQEWGHTNVRSLLRASSASGCPSDSSTSSDCCQDRRAPSMSPAPRKDSPRCPSVIAS
jgi:DNA-binding SARP family transcriptional activator/transcriptional regulator with XRE-family HTH domain